MKPENGPAIRKRWLAVIAVLVLILWAGVVEAMATLDQQLIEAAKVGDLAQVKALLDGGADVTAKNDGGTTALMAASGGGHVEVVQLLLDRNVDVDAKDHVGETPLMYAASKGSFEVVKLLVENGADLTAKGRDGATAMEMAQRRGDAKTVEFIKVRSTNAPWLKTWSGEVVSSTPRALGVRIHDTCTTKVVMLRLAPSKRSSVALRYPVGAMVMRRCQLEGGGKLGCVLDRLSPAEAGAGFEDIRWPCSEQETLPLKILKGKVVSSLIRTLSVQVYDGGGTDLTTVRVALRTKFTPFSRPREGQRVEVTYREQDGNKFAYAVTVVGPLK
jgi:hypothetical protein